MRFLGAKYATNAFAEGARPLTRCGCERGGKGAGRENGEEK